MLEELDGSDLLSSRGTSVVSFLLCVLFIPIEILFRKEYAHLCIFHAQIAVYSGIVDNFC